MPNDARVPRLLSPCFGDSVGATTDNRAPMYIECVFMYTDDILRRQERLHDDGGQANPQTLSA